MAKISIETEDFNALTLVRGLELFISLNGGAASLEDFGNVSEEVADLIGENYDKAFGGDDDPSDKVFENLKAMHKELLATIEQAVIASKAEKGEDE